jgi:predicted adenylyl cyclase CyaB
MIEVEKKFILSDDDIGRLTNGAEFLGEKKMKDVYYDTKDFLLTCADKWLRLRGARWELKLPLRTDGGWHDQYRELETEEEISNELGLDTKKQLEEELARAGYEPFASIITTRKKYKKGDFTIDLDEVDFGYKIGEIELMVNDESDMPGAIEKITNFAKKAGLTMAPVRGKLIEYLRRNSPKHYQALIDAGVIKLSHCY